MQANAVTSDVLAEETHAGRVWGLIILGAIMGPASSVALYPAAPACLALGVLQHGVEIRTLGLRLRSIPKQAVLSYSIEPWSWVRGFGIRGIGNRRAYVWGTKVVHIKTTNGEFFWGHSNPERIVQDLNLVTGFVARG